MKKTTLHIPEGLYRQVKRRAAEQGRTVSEVVAEYLHRGLTEAPKPVKLPPLPTYNMGPPLVDIADRDAVYDALDQDDPFIQKLRRDKSR